MYHKRLARASTNLRDAAFRTPLRGFCSSGTGNGNGNNDSEADGSRVIERRVSSTLQRKLIKHHSLPGLGAARIMGHYDVLGGSVAIPPFLKQPKQASIIGAPLSWGQPHGGTDQGPALLREAGLTRVLRALEWDVDERGDLEFDAPSADDPLPDQEALNGNVRNCFCLGKGLEKIYREVVQSLENGSMPLILGGDHSIGLATVAAVLTVRPHSGIIWVDAHGDLNSPSTSPSGNFHGMPLGMLLGLYDSNLLPGFEWMNEVPLLKPDQLTMVGLRDLDLGERQVIRSLGIKAYTMQHVDHYGIGKVMDMAIDHLTLSDGTLRPIHMSYDIDAVDPAEAPSTGTVVRGGLNFREAHYVAEAVSSSGMLGSMDLVEVNPTLKPGKEAELTCHLGMALIASAMGSRIL